jgi:hypothetical protein
MTSRNLERPEDFESIHHQLNKAPDFVMVMQNTERNTAFVDRTNLSPELTSTSAPVLYARSTVEYGRSLRDGSSIRGAPLNHGESAMQNTLNATNPGKPQSCGIGVELTRKYHNIEPHPVGRSLKVLKDKPRKRKPDPTRAFVRGPNPYGRKGTLKCKLCRRSRLKVAPHEPNLILVYFYS